MATEKTRNATAADATEAAPAGPKIRWDDTHMQSAYANVCNVASTREEVVLLFGINQAWHSGQQEIPIQLSSRIIVSPHVAKRLSILLDNVLKEYESRFGALPVSR
ncbi:MAG TPA: DUF3467 domain-containing protein [Candidatus Methylomirabilis sp.]|nr:DUF3467 domain-containing protein [Candidatus Methylomirabilis sp.]